ncbi:hypothetical protein FHG87_016607 [Trinorchestia longiramus]|nr:hypothetical protein FHG87_016607 [Trinorchestia longiramus]
MAKSTISTILKYKEVLKKADVAIGVTAISKQRPQIMEEMEKLLLIFTKEKMLTGDSISEALICEKSFQILFIFIIYGNEPGPYSTASRYPHLACLVHPAFYHFLQDLDRRKFDDRSAEAAQLQKAEELNDGYGGALEYVTDKNSTYH